MLFNESLSDCKLIEEKSQYGVNCLQTFWRGNTDFDKMILQTQNQIDINE